MNALANACAAGLIAPCATLGVIVVAIAVVVVVYFVMLFRS